MKSLFVEYLNKINSYYLNEKVNLLKKYSNITGKSIEDLEKLWSKAKKIVKKQYNLSEEDPGFYRVVVGILKNMLKL